MKHNNVNSNPIAENANNTKLMEVNTMNNTIVTIVEDTNAPTGYALEWEGNHVMIDKCDPFNGNPTLHLPENPSNRRFYKVSKILKGETTLGYKESKPTGPRDLSVGWEAHMTEDERKAYEAIKAAVVERRRKAQEDKANNKNLTELEKAKRAYEKAMAKVKELQAKCGK